MAQRQFRSDDTSVWSEKYGTGSDGAYAPSTGTDAPIDSACTGTINTTSLSATNVSFAIGQLILIHQTRGTGAGQWELNKIAGYTAGTITTSYNLIYGYATGAQVLVLPQYSSGSIAGGVTLTGKAWNGTVGGVYAKICNGTFTIAGTLTLSGKGFRGGASINGGSTNDTAYQGESATGAGIQNNSANGSGGGGGMHDTGNRGAGGGGGGHAATGTDGQTNTNNGSLLGGTKGATAGSADLITAVFGGAGGAGPADSSNYDNAGGNSGGFIFIIAKTLVVSGSVVNNGANGTNASSGKCGSGAGAGGSVLLKCVSATLGSGLITASGATGGAALDANFEPAGGNGAVGRIHSDYGASITGTTTPTIDSRPDTTLSDAGGSFIFNMI